MHFLLDPPLATSSCMSKLLITYASHDALHMFSDVNRLLDQYIYIILRLQQEQECSGCSLTEVAVEKAAAGEG